LGLLERWQWELDSTARLLCLGGACPACCFFRVRLLLQLGETEIEDI
jgi:hypothetical protein